MTLNGRPYLLDGPASISQVLRQADFDPGRVAVLLNGEIVVKEAFGTTDLKDDDALEVVSFVGGG